MTACGRGCVPLFEQLGRKTYLTRAGMEMLHYSRAIIQQFREADEAMQQLKGVIGRQAQRRGDQRRRLFFPRLLAEFTRRHPGAVLNLTVHNRAELLHQLATTLPTWRSWCGRRRTSTVSTSRSRRIPT